MSTTTDTALAAVIKVLHEGRADLDWQDAADILWLSALRTQHQTENQATDRSASDDGGTSTGSRQTGNSGRDGNTSGYAPKDKRGIDTDEDAHPTSTAASGGQGWTPALGLASNRSNGVGAALERVTALLGRRDMERGLKQLRRVRRTSRRQVLDVEATIRHYVDTRVLVPIQGPDQERWLDLTLVIDQSETMAPWERTLAEFQHMMGHLGVFAQLTTWRLEWNRSGGIWFTSSRGERHTAKHLIDPTGRTVTMIATDCMHHGWSIQPIWDAIDELGRYGPLTIMQMLPRRLWASTQLGEPETIVRSDRPGQTNSTLRVETPWWWDNLEDGTIGHAVPIVGLQHERLAMWARLITGAQDAKVPAALLDSFKERSETLQAIAPVSDPQQRVTDVQRTISPDAMKLAVLLSAVPVTVEVARLVQATQMPDSRTEHLAEVWSSGLIQVNPSGGYEFRDGVRKALQEQLTATSAAAVHTSVISRLHLTNDHADLAMLGIHDRANAIAVSEDVLDRFGLGGSGFDAEPSGDEIVEGGGGSSTAGDQVTASESTKAESADATISGPARILVLGEPGDAKSAVVTRLEAMGVEPSPIIGSTSVDDFRPTHIVVALNEGDDLAPDIAGQVAAFVSLFDELPSNGLPVVVFASDQKQMKSAFAIGNWGKDALIVEEGPFQPTDNALIERLAMYRDAGSLFVPPTSGTPRMVDVLNSLALHFHAGRLDDIGASDDDEARIRTFYGVAEDVDVHDYWHVRDASEFVFAEIGRYIALDHDLLAWGFGYQEPGWLELQIAASHFMPRDEGLFRSFVGIGIEEAIAVCAAAMPRELQVALAPAGVQAQLARFLTPLRRLIGPAPSSFRELSTDPVSYVDRLCNRFEFYFERALGQSPPGEDDGDSAEQLKSAAVETSQVDINFALPYRTVVEVLDNGDFDYSIRTHTANGDVLVQLPRAQLAGLVRALCQQLQRAVEAAVDDWPTADEHAARACTVQVGEPMQAYGSLQGEDLVITGGVDLSMGSTVSVIEGDQLLPGRVVGERDRLHALHVEGGLVGPFLGTEGDYVTEAACMSARGEAVTVALQREDDRYRIMSPHSLSVGAPLIRNAQIVGIVLSDIAAAPHESMRSLWQQGDVLGALRSDENALRRPLVFADSPDTYLRALERSSGVTIDVRDWDPETNELIQEPSDDHRYLRIFDRSAIRSQERPGFPPLRTWISFEDLQSISNWQELPGVFRVLRASPERMSSIPLSNRSLIAGVEMPASRWTSESMSEVKRFGRLKAIANQVEPYDVAQLMELRIDLVIGSDVEGILQAVDDYMESGGLEGSSAIS